MKLVIKFSPENVDIFVAQLEDYRTSLTKEMKFLKPHHKYDPGESADALKALNDSADLNDVATNLNDFAKVASNTQYFPLVQLLGKCFLAASVFFFLTCVALTFEIAALPVVASFTLGAIASIGIEALWNRKTTYEPIYKSQESSKRLNNFFTTMSNEINSEIKTDEAVDSFTLV